MNPYYQDDRVTLYHGDCLEIDAWLKADVLVTDPPYGIAWTQRGTYAPKTGRTHNVRQNIVSGDESTQARDAALTLWSYRPAIIFGTWKASRPQHVRHRLIWDKRGSCPGPSNSPFYSVDEEIYVLGSGFRSSSPPQRTVISTYEIRQIYVSLGHPTPKPVQLMEILVDRCPPGVIADPFAGSGSTLVAARNLGRQAIGVEIEERYCELTARRLDQLVLDFGEGA